MGAKLDFMDDIVIGKIFDGKYRDFDNAWYKVIGSIFLVSLCIQAFNPLIDFTVTYLTQKIYVWRDQGRFFN